MKDELIELLDGYQYQALLDMANHAGVAIETAAGRRLDKLGLIRVLSEELLTKERISQALAQLGSLERIVLHRVLLDGGEVETGALRQRLAREGIVQPGRSLQEGILYEGRPFDPKAQAFEDVMARLALVGLVLSRGIPESWGQRKRLSLSPGLTLRIPALARRWLPQPAVQSIEWGDESLPAPVDEVNLPLAQRELFLYWSAVRHTPLALTQGGLVRKRELRELNERLTTPDLDLSTAPRESAVPRLHFIRLLLLQLGLLVEQDQHIWASDPLGKVPQYWEQAVEERTCRAIQAWVDLGQWSELSSLGLPAFALDLPRARRKLLEQLHPLPGGVWFSSERFSHRLSLLAPDLLFESQSSFSQTASYYAEDTYGIGNTRRLAEMQAAFIGRVLSGPLHWLGVVEISSDVERLLAFRLTEGGVRSLHLALTVSSDKQPVTLGPSDEEGRLVVQPSFHILALGPVREAALAQLETFADRVKADRSALEYVVTRDTVYRAQVHGLPTDAVLAFLRQVSSVPIPQNVLRTVQEWGQDYERIVFHSRVALCQTATPDLSAHLWDDPAVRSHLGQRLTPTVVTIKRGHLRALQDDLLQRGMLPAVSEKGDSCAGRVQATAEGELKPLWEGPDLLLGACLHAVAEERDGRFYVTQKAVADAMAGGMSVREYLTRLHTVHRGPVPTWLEAQVKSWSHYYGQASLEQTTLLEVKDSATAAELLADPQLAPFLSTFPADPRGRLLLVHARDLQAFRDLLLQHGIDLS